MIIRRGKRVVNGGRESPRLLYSPRYEDLAHAQRQLGRNEPFHPHVTSATSASCFNVILITTVTSPMVLAREPIVTRSSTCANLRPNPIRVPVHECRLRTGSAYCSRLIWHPISRHPSSHDLQDVMICHGREWIWYVHPPIINSGIFGKSRRGANQERAWGTSTHP